MFEQMKYVLDDTTTFWAIGPNFSVLAKQAEYCGKEVEMIVPFEETNVGEVHYCFMRDNCILVIHA